MCRFLIYKGREMFMSDLLTKSEQSLIRQSHHARERKEPLNGDGFGAGWYVPEIDPIPCVFTSTSPAWSNRNLHRLAEKIRSTCFFAHVRAASPGMLVSEANCHPFQYDEFLWMHNGRIAMFDRTRRNLRESLDDVFYNMIQGTTDSEHTFALFLNILAPRLQDYDLSDLQKAMVATIETIGDMSKKASIDEPSHCNFAVTDGRNVVVSRYVTRADRDPPTLYVAAGERFEASADGYHMRPSVRHPNAVIVASEPLTEDRSDWTLVPPNHLLIITPELHVRTVPIH